MSSHYHLVRQIEMAIRRGRQETWVWFDVGTEKVCALLSVATVGLTIDRACSRMNVAITRAKELLVVIGNGAILQRDPYWRPFLQFALRHGLYVDYVTSMERQALTIFGYLATLGRN